MRTGFPVFLRATAFFIVLFAGPPAVPAFAWSGGSGMGAGQIPCEQEADGLGRRIDRQARQMPARQVYQLRQQLAVARAQCKQSLDAASPTLAMIRQDLDKWAPPARR